MVGEWQAIENAPWFPLDIYSRTLSFAEWERVLASRMAAKWMYEKLTETGSVPVKFRRDPMIEVRPGETLEELALHIFDEFVTADGGFGRVFTREDAQDSRWPIDGLNEFEAVFCAKICENDENLELAKFAEFAATEPAEAIRALPDVFRLLERSPHALDSATSDGGSSHLGEFLNYRIPLSVDVTLDDETLSQAFSIWLAGMRAAIGAETPKPYTDKDLADWQLFAILPAFDLTLWSEIKGLKYTGAFISRRIYVDKKSYDINEYDRYRQTTKRLVDEVFTWGNIERFSRQRDIVAQLSRIREKVDVPKPVDIPGPEESES